MRSDMKIRFAWASLFIGMVFLALFGGCTKPELEQVRISPQEASLFPGGSATFKAVALSASGQPISVENFKWSVEGDAGIVDGSGRFTAKRPGKATVVATFSGRSGKALVTVKPPPIAGLTLTTQTIRALAGSTLLLQIKGVTSDEQPAGYNDVSLSSPTEGVSFSSQNVSLGETGEAEVSVTIAGEPSENTIVARSGQVTETLSLEGTRITGLQITPPETVFEVGQRVGFKALGSDAYGNTLPLEAVWSLTGVHAELDANGPSS